MTRYAQATSVAPEQSRAEIERTLNRYGASGFMYGWQEKDGVRHEMIRFQVDTRHVRFVLDMPSRDDKEFWFTPSRRNKRSEAAAYKAWEQACRQRWRALALAIKAKLEVVEAGIAEFEDEFLAHIVLPDNSTVSQFMRPQIAAAYESGKMPKLLPELAGD